MRKNSLNKNSLVSFSLVIAAISFLFCTYEDGITGKTLKSSEPGCLCPSETSSSEVSVSINGPEILAPGETAAYTIKISGGPLIRGGANIAASGGILQPGEGLQKIGGELTHILPKLPQYNEVIFEFLYTAPNTQTTTTLYANGNSVNFSGTENGDAWNFAENKIIVIGIVANSEDEIDENSFYLSQNYPNPFNPSTSIRFQIANSGFVTLKVYDVLGNETADLVNEEKQPGVYEVEFNSNNYTSGIYFYTLKTEDNIITKKMLLLK
jgi:hypothetical protein